ncbi:MAG TPA: hypothetical protein VGW33_01610 [Terriglobia bacterium]|nr:hypothetical protein [Terriglobia bacterium]
MKRHLAIGIGLCLLTPALGGAADHLKLTPGLDYIKNSWQGPIIKGHHMGDGIVKGMPNYIFFYAEFCYNAKREALRTVELYRDYGDRVHFVIVDASRPVPRLAQMPLVHKFFNGDFPHTTILDKNGKVVFDYTGEVDDATLMGWMDAAVRAGGETAKPDDNPPKATAGN